MSGIIQLVVIHNVGVVYLFDGISTLVSHLMPKPFLQMDCGAIV